MTVPTVRPVSPRRLTCDLGHRDECTAEGIHGGEGVPQDYVLAYAWLNLAEMSGDEAAPGVLEAAKVKWTKKEIQLLMTAEQIARAQEMSTNLFNRINPPPTK